MNRSPFHWTYFWCSGGICSWSVQYWLNRPTVQPEKGTDAVSTVEDPHSGSGEPDIYLLIDVLKGNRIVHTLHRNVVGSFRFRAMLIGIGENWHTTFFYYYEYMRYVNNGISLWILAIQMIWTFIGKSSSRDGHNMARVSTYIHNLTKALCCFLTF